MGRSPGRPTAFPNPRPKPDQVLIDIADTGVGIHPGMTGNLLSGAPLTKGAELHGGVSLDQVLASHIGDQTVQPSMVLGCEQPVTGYHETNFSMAYSSHISWSSPTSPVPMEVYPSLAFDSLFENRGSQRNLSVLDRVRDEVRADEAVGRVPTDEKAAGQQPEVAVAESHRQTAQSGLHRISQRRSRLVRLGRAVRPQSDVRRAIAHEERDQRYAEQ